jgi:hypothetical protein
MSLICWAMGKVLRGGESGVALCATFLKHIILKKGLHG